MPSPRMSSLLVNALLRCTLLLSLLLSSLLLTACSEPWNNPNPPEEGKDQTIYYGNVSSRLQHLDPARSYSSEEALFIDQVYEAPFRYHFLKRPYVLEPALATKLPTITYFDKDMKPVPEDSKQLAFSVYTINLKTGVRYQPHPAFSLNSSNKPLYLFDNEQDSAQYKTVYDFPETGTREMTAEDLAYGIKRIADPKNKSPLLGFMSNYIVGMTEFSKKVADLPLDSWRDLRTQNLEGVQAIDDHTLTIRIKGRYPQFRYWMALHFFAPIPWETDRFYHNPGFQARNMTLDWYPVGTGAFMMTRNDPNRGINLARNPNYRVDPYPSEGEESDIARGYLKDAGKPMPLIDKAVFKREKESLPQWTKFMQGWYDRSGDDSSNISASNFDMAFVMSSSGLDLSDEMTSRGITVDSEIKPATYYYAFNMKDPIVGGYTEDKQKLRQAIGLVWDTEDLLEIFANGRGVAAMGPLPPGIPGFKDGKEGLNPYVYDWVNGEPKRKSVETAKKLLAQAGYPNGRGPDGKPLIIYIDTTGNDSGPLADWRRRQLGKIGIQLEYRSSDYVRFKEKIRNGNTQVFGWGWLADYPDPENFLFLLDGAQTSEACQCDGNNSSNYDNPEFNRLFQQMKTMENSPERMALIDKMVEIFRKDSPWIGAYHPKEYYLNNSWVNNTKRHGIGQDTLKYISIDNEERRARQQEWNKPVVWPLLITLGLAVLIFFPAMAAYRRRQTLRINTGSSQNRTSKNNKGEG